MTYLELFSIMFFFGAFGLVGLTYFKRVRLEQDAQSSMKENEVLKGISFSIRRGEIFGLLGPSGAGKTTLIKILTGQMLANSGRALVFDTLPTSSLLAVPA